MNWTKSTVDGRRERFSVSGSAEGMTVDFSIGVQSAFKIMSVPRLAHVTDTKLLTWRAI